MRLVLGFHFESGAHVAEILDAVSQLSPRFLPPKFGSARTDTWMSRNRRLALCIWESENHPQPRTILQDHRLAFAHAGYLNDASASAETVLGNLRPDTEAAPLQHPWGGIASYFLADQARDRLLCWSTEPQLENVFLARGDGYLVAGSRPLAVHLAARRAATLDIDETWVRMMVPSGMAVMDKTSLRGTSFLKPRATAVLSGFGIGVVAHENRPYKLPRSQKQRARLYTEELLRSMSVLGEIPTAELRVSGGKDSRVLAAAAQRLQSPVVAVTFGEPGHWESPTAAEVANQAGLRHILLQPGFAFDDLRVEAKKKIRFADGLLSETRHLGYQVPEPLGEHAPLILGHAHHLRGGFTAPRLATHEKVKQRLFRVLTRDRAYASAELVREFEPQIDRYLRETAVRNRKQYFYRLYNDYRVARWLAAVYLEWSGHRPLVFPFCDHRVVRVCTALKHRDRATEAVQYSVLKNLSPELAELPLFRASWKFAKPGPVRRWLKPPPIISEKAQGVPRLAPERQMAIVGPELAEVVTGSRAKDVLSSAVAAPYWRLLENRDFEQMNRLPNRSAFFDFVWRLYGLALVLEADWI